MITLITDQSVVKADISLELCPSMLELDYRHFGSGDRQHVVHNTPVLLQRVCQNFNYLDTVQALHSQYTMILYDCHNHQTHVKKDTI